MVSSSTSLVNVADDAELRLVSALADVSNTLSVKECEACISDGDASKLLQLITKDTGAMQAFLTMENTEEATACFSLLAALVEKTDNKPAMARALAETVAAAPDASEASVSRKLQLLSVLYNMQTVKVDILTQMFAAAGKYPNVFLAEETTLGALLLAPDDGTSLTPPAPVLVSHLDNWQVSEASRRKIYQTIASSLSDTRKQSFLLLLLESYNKDVDAAGRQAAQQAAVGAIRDPIALFRQQRNMIDRKSVV